MELIPILKRAIRTLQGSNRHILTYAHCELAFCCAQSRCYHLAYPEIDSDLVEVQGGGAIKALDNLKYHYYSGLASIALKKYRRAMECFTMALTAPSDCLSCVQIEAYKKYILVSLVLKQKVRLASLSRFVHSTLACRQLEPLPRYTPANLKRYYRKFCSSYLEISDAFDRGVEAVSKIVEKNTEVYVTVRSVICRCVSSVPPQTHKNKDYNFGLVKQVVKTLKKNAVRKLTSVYTRLAMEKVAELCSFESPAQAKEVLISMIRNNELSATLDSNGVVKFEETVTESDAKMLASIHQRMKSVLELWTGLDDSQLDIKKTPGYIKKALNLGPAAGNDELAQQMLMEAAFSGGAGFFRG